MVRSTSSFPDHNQNFWQLACIQSASQSLPGFLIGGVLAKKYGAMPALSSICIGNLLLWLIGLGIITMAAKGRKNVIQVSQEYLGKRVGILVAVILAFAFMFWYIIELESVTGILGPLLLPEWESKVVGFLLGSIIAVLSIGGIRFIKWICVWSLPFLFLIMGFAIFYYGRVPSLSSFDISFPGIVIIGILTLPGFVNLSTFFRHSHSKYDSVLALSIMTVFDILLQIPSVFLDFNFSFDFFISSSFLFSFVSCVFILISFVCLNLTNIYFASAGIEVLFPRFRSPLKYFWIGIAASTGYFFYRSSVSMNFLEFFVNNCAINLGVILLASFLVKTVVNKRPGKLQKVINFICWTIGCTGAFIYQAHDARDANVTFLAGIWATILAFLCAFFIQQVVSVIKQLRMTSEHLE